MSSSESQNPVKLDLTSEISVLAGEQRNQYDVTLENQSKIKLYHEPLTGELVGAEQSIKITVVGDWTMQTLEESVKYAQDSMKQLVRLVKHDQSQLEGIEIVSETVTLQKDGTATLKLLLTPEEVRQPKEVDWTILSGDADVLKLDENSARLTVNSAGIVEVQVQADTFTASKVFTVQEAETIIPNDPNSGDSEPNIEPPKQNLRGQNLVFNEGNYKLKAKVSFSPEIVSSEPVQIEEGTTYTADNDLVRILKDNTISLKGEGETKVTVTSPVVNADGNTKVSSTVGIKIFKDTSEKLTFSGLQIAPIENTAVGESSTIKLTSVGEPFEINFFDAEVKSLTPETCLIDGNTVRTTAQGLCTLSATINGCYAEYTFISKNPIVDRKK